jgi:hypothetical protein
VEQACAIVKDLLRAGPQPVDEILRQAQEAGVSRRTLERAKAELRIESQFQRDKEGKRWLWILPRPDTGADALDWPEQHKREMEQAQKESDAFMARIREKYVGRKGE